MCQTITCSAPEVGDGLPSAPGRIDADPDVAALRDSGRRPARFDASLLDAWCAFSTFLSSRIGPWSRWLARAFATSSSVMKDFEYFHANHECMASQALVESHSAASIYKNILSSSHDRPKPSTHHASAPLAEPLLLGALRPLV